MNELLNVLPESEKNFESSKSNSLNALETSRVTKFDVINHYYADKRLGLEQDSRIAEFNGIKPLKFSDIKSFHDSKVSNKPFSYCIVASNKNVKTADMEKFGKLNTLSLEQIFGY